MIDAQQTMRLQEELLALRIADWYDKLSSWQFAFLVVLLIVPWIIWWKMADRNRITEIFTLGLLASIISSLLNGNGLNLMLWSYPYTLLPFSPRAYSFSLSAIPVTFMLLYQYLPKWKSYAIGVTIIAGVTAFLLQPLFSLAGIYKLIKWNYFYSFLALLFIGFLARMIQEKVLQSALKPAGSDSNEYLIHVKTHAAAYKRLPGDKADERQIIRRK